MSHQLDCDSHAKNSAARGYLFRCMKSQHTLQLHQVWAVAVDHGEQSCPITNIPHQLFQNPEVRQLSARCVIPTVSYLATDRGKVDTMNPKGITLYISSFRYVLAKDVFKHHIKCSSQVWIKGGGGKGKKSPLVVKPVLLLPGLLFTNVWKWKSSVFSVIVKREICTDQPWEDRGATAWKDGSFRRVKSEGQSNWATRASRLETWIRWPT